jgi:hypothetical protein
MCALKHIVVISKLLIILDNVIVAIRDNARKISVD